MKKVSVNKIDSKIEMWKNKLLDMGKGNRLLNYKDSKTITLKIISPNIDDLYKKIVIDEKKLKFSYEKQEAEYVGGEEVISAGNEKKADGDAEEHIEFEDAIIQPRIISKEILGDIITDKTTKDTLKVLKNLKGRASMAKEEQGINVLYMSFGFLKWFEKEHPKEIMMAPIVLVPVILERESIISPYIVSVHEDEVVVNPTLVYKLQNEFKTELPEFDVEDVNVQKYLNEVEQVVHKHGFYVERNVGISLLSFLKINMYTDLEQHSEKIKKHDIIRRLAGEDLTWKQENDVWVDTFDHDKEEPPKEVFQVVDADSSQQDAITISKKGYSFVLQGPPGTGKSQTITNIIAEALADGKKVLFVSEKMAALEVVYNRLAAAGLDDFCLVLHSNKANKRVFLDSLMKVLDLKKISISDEADYKLKRLLDIRNKLNQYNEDLHKKIYPLNQSVYDAEGLVSSLGNVKKMSFSLDGIDVASISRDEYYELKSNVRKFAEAKKRLTEPYFTNTWKDIDVRKYDAALYEDIKETVEKLSCSLENFNENALEYKNVIDLDINCCWRKISDLRNALDYCGNAKNVPENWISADIDDLKSKAVRMQTRQTRRRELEAEICEYANEKIVELDVDIEKKSIDDSISKAKNLLNLTEININNTLGKLDYIIEIIENAEKCFETQNNIIKLITAEISIGRNINLENLMDVCDFLDEYSLDLRANEFWFSPRWDNKQERLGKRKNMIDILSGMKSTKEKILSDYDPEILDIDYRGILSRFRTEYTSFTKVFKKQYRLDYKEIKANKRTQGEKISSEEIINLLEQIQEYKQRKKVFDDLTPEFEKYFGEWFQGEDTDIEQIDKVVSVFEKIKEFYGEDIPENTKNKVISGKNIGAYIAKARDLRASLDNDKVSEFLKITKGNSLKDIEDLCNITQEAKEILLNCKKEIDEVCTSYSVDTDVMKYYDLLVYIQEYQEINKGDIAINNDLKGDFGILYEERETDWDYIKDRLNWMETFKGCAKAFNFTDEFQKNVISDNFSRSLCLETAKYLETFEENNSISIKKFLALFYEDSTIQNDMNMDRLQGFIKKCNDNILELRDWVDLYYVIDVCEKNGLAEFIRETLETEIPNDEIELSFEKQFQLMWLKKSYDELPDIKTFRKASQEQNKQEFCELDKLQFEIAKSRIRKKLISELPILNSFTSSKDEVGVLQREAGKKRKIMPVRKIFNAIPNLLPRLKPCMMMSPLSVSLFLQSDRYEFDMIIFDEASQVKTENAIGAISRGRQVIIAGDKYQMPPTNFFTSAISDDETEDEYDDSAAFESVLDEAATVLPQMTLKWHYRSRNEQLIAFSNNKIYDNKLITFPSPIDESEESGVKYVYVENGIYDRSRKRTNAIEAEKVVELIFDEIKQHPDNSLGVIAFSSSQQQCIEDKLINKRIIKPEYEEFFSENKNEPFFIKNLENVQGDERDTIIFSIGYGKAASDGDLRMNFGPLNKSGGERRLNVAVTRARSSIKLVGSILPTDMKIKEDTPKGVKLLRDYIEYAQNGSATLQNSEKNIRGNSSDDLFEDTVYNFLEEQGYIVERGIGCSDYKVGIAVRDSKYNNRFVLGIECNGKTWSSCRTARERERLRQAVLKNMGWNIYNVWSTEWARNLIAEKKILVDTVESIINGNANNVINVQTSSNVAVTGVNYENIIDDDNEEKVQFDFDIYMPKHFRRVNGTAATPRIAREIESIATEQAPIHIQLVYKQLAPLYGNDKVTSKVRDGVDDVIKLYGEKAIWKVDGEYLWLKKKKKITPRIAGDSGPLRQLEYVAKEELVVAMKEVIKKSYGINQEGLYKTIINLYGYARSTSKMQEYLDHAYQLLLNDKSIKVQDEKLYME